MALKDYNSSNFKNAAMDRLSGKFGKGPGDGVKKSSATTAATLPNPWARPATQAVTAPTVSKPTSTLSSDSSLKNNTSLSASTPETTKSAKDVRRENRVKALQAKGDAKVQQINQRASLTPEQKSEKRQKTGSNIGKAVERTIEAAGGALGVYATYQGLKNKD